MLKHLCLFFLSFIWFSCSLVTSTDEPIQESKIELMAENAYYDFCGSYISENLKEYLEIYPKMSTGEASFVYIENYNSQEKIKELGKWALENDTIFINFENGNKDFLIFKNDTLFYGENLKIFLPAATITFTVTKNPSFNGDYDNDI